MKTRSQSLLPIAASLFITMIPANAELIGYWNLDDNFDDTSGKGNNGTLVGGATYSADRPAALAGGMSVAFDGASGTYGVINPGSGGMAITTLPEYTVSMWVKGDAGAGSGRADDRIFSEAMTTNNNPLFNVGTHNSGADGTVDIFVRNGAAAETLNHAHSTGTGFDGEWHHIVFSGGSDSMLDLYIDGTFDQTFDYSNVPAITPDTTTIGGILRATDCCNFQGNIDDVAVWDEALVQADITSLFAGTSPSLIRLPPDDTDGDGLPDAWETANNLDPDDDGTTDPDNGADGDPDMDDSSNAQEFANRTDPQDPDSDDDGSNDGAEALAGTNPLIPDTDGDGLNDGDEATAGTNPLLADSDGDGVGDNAELLAGTDPNDIESPSIGGLLCAYWPLDSTDGLTTPDLEAGYDLDLINMDASNFVSDEGRMVASFDGVDALLARIHAEGDDLPISQHPAFTISMWVKVVGTGQNDRRFFSEGSTLDGNPLLNLGTRNNGADGSFDVFLRDGDTPNHQYSNGMPLDGSWRHIAYTHSDLNKKIQLYVDGVLDRDDWIFKDITTPLDTTSIGAILRATSCCWVAGLVDDVSLWKGVMSPEKIAELAAGTSPGDLAGGSGFRITSITRDAAGNVSFTWNSRENAEYGVYASTDLRGSLEESWIELDDSFGSQGEETTYTLPAGSLSIDPAVETRIYFRVTR